MWGNGNRWLGARPLLATEALVGDPRPHANLPPATTMVRCAARAVVGGHRVAPTATCNDDRRHRCGRSGSAIHSPPGRRRRRRHGFWSLFAAATIIGRRHWAGGY